MRAARALLGADDPMPVSLIVPRVAAVVVGVLSLTLLFIGARSPYTHSNLLPGYDASYGRTDQIVVGAPVAYAGIGGAIPAGDEVRTGERLFVTEGCVTCHGLGGRGGIVGPAIQHDDAQTLRQRTRLGSQGMPRFSDALTEQEIAAIGAYLRSIAGSEGR